MLRYQVPQTSIFRSHHGDANSNQPQLTYTTTWCNQWSPLAYGERTRAMKLNFIAPRIISLGQIAIIRIAAALGASPFVAVSII